MRCWGNNQDGQLGDGTGISLQAPPANDVLTGVKAITAGVNFTCALMTTGGVKCWGGGAVCQDSPFYGLQHCKSFINFPATPTDVLGEGVQAISASDDQVCALMANRDERCWSYLYPSRPASDILIEVQALATGGGPCALTDTGVARCWSNNSAGQVEIQDVLEGAKAVTCGGDHSCALMTTGGVKCWGNNGYGQLGDGTGSYTSAHYSPPQSDVLTNVQAIATSCSDELSAGSHTCALTLAGGVRCWGFNNEGQLGDGTVVSNPTPPLTDVLTGVKAIAAGSAHTCALTTSGGVRCWGNNASGQLGDGTTTNALAPPTSDVIADVQAIAAGGYHTCALMQAGSVRCWGDNALGQLGDGTTTNALVPTTSDVLTGVQAIAAGAVHTCVLMQTGGVRCWGNNVSGQLGEGLGVQTAVTPPAADVLAGVRAVVAGTDYTCAVMQTSGVRCWGMATDWTPSTDMLTGVRAIAVGRQHVCALTTAGGVRCWWSNSCGQLGDGTTEYVNTADQSSEVLTGVQAIAAGGDHTCALTTTGGVRCWGDGSDGALGDGTIGYRTTPVQVAVTCQ